MLCLDCMGGGAWPFLVGKVICLLNFVNKRENLPDPDIVRINRLIMMVAGFDQNLIHSCFVIYSLNVIPLFLRYLIPH